MNRYLYNNEEFTQDDVELAAKNHGVELVDYLTNNSDIVLIEDSEGDGDKEKKKKKWKRKKKKEVEEVKIEDISIKPDGSYDWSWEQNAPIYQGQFPDKVRIDQLLGIKTPEVIQKTALDQTKVNQYSSNLDVMDAANTGEIKLKFSDPKLDIKKTKLANTTRKILSNIDESKIYTLSPETEMKEVGVKDVEYVKPGNFIEPIGEEINRGQWIVKEDKNGNKQYFKLEDIINEDFNLLQTLTENNLEIEDFVELLGEEYEFYDNSVAEEVLKAKEPLDTFVITDYATWKNKKLKNQNWHEYFDNTLTADIFNDTEGEASASLDLLLPEGFTTEETGWFKDQVKIIAPNGDSEVFQVDLSIHKPKQLREIGIQIQNLKEFVERNRYSEGYKIPNVDPEGEPIVVDENLDGWKWDDWKNRINEVRKDYLTLMNVPVDQGGVGLTQAQSDKRDELFNVNTLMKSLYRIGNPMSAHAEDNYGIDPRINEFEMNSYKFKLLFRAINITNLQRKQQGLTPISSDFNLQQLRNHLTVDYENFDLKAKASPGNLGYTDNLSSTPAVIFGDDSTLPEITETQFYDILTLAVQLGKQDFVAKELEKNVEKWAETNELWHTEQETKNKGFGTAGSNIVNAQNQFLFKEAEAEANVFKINYLEKEAAWDNLPNKHVIENFNKNNTFAAYNTSSPTASLMSTLNTSIIPEPDENGNATEDIYIKIKGKRDKKGNQLMFLIKEGEPLYSEGYLPDGSKNPNSSGSITFNPVQGYTTLDGDPVAMMPISQIMKYNNANADKVSAQGLYYNKVNYLMDQIENLPNFEDQVAAWDKNYNELQDWGVTLGVGGLSLAKNLYVGAAALTMYINPAYWGGKMVGLDGWEALSEGNAYLQGLLDQEVASYNFSMSSFDEGNLSTWEGFKAYVEWGGHMFMDTLPIMAAMILSGGSSSYAAVISSSIAGISAMGGEMSDMDVNNKRLKDEIAEIQADGGIDPETKKELISKKEAEIKKAGSFDYMAPAVIMGGFEFLGSFATTGQWAKGMNRLIFKEGSAATKPLYSNWGQRLKAGSKSWLKEANTEGLGESFVTLGDNWLHGRPLSTGLLEAYSGGFAITGLLDGAGKGYSGLSMTNYASNKEIKDLSKTQQNLVEQHKLLDEIDSELKILETPEAKGVPVDATKYKKISDLKAKQAEVESQIADLAGEMETKVISYKEKLQAKGMRLVSATMYAKNQARLSELRIKALNLASDPTVEKEGSEANIELQKINAEYKSLENLNQAFLDHDSFGNDWAARKIEGKTNKKVREENNVIQDQAIQKIKEKQKNQDYVPDQSEIDAEAVKIVDEQIYEENNAKAAVIADQGGWNYNNNSTNAEGITSVELAYNEAIKNTDPNEMVEVKVEDGSKIEIPLIEYLEVKKQKAIEGIKDGTVNGFFDEDINTQFNFKENAIKNQKTGVPLHEGAHGATKKLIKADPEGFKEQAGILVEFLRSEQPEVFAKMQIEGTNNLQNQDGTWDFEEVFSSFVEEVAAGNIDLDAYRDFTAFFGMKLNEGLMDVSKGEFRVDFKGTNDISNFFLKLGEEIGMGEVSLETMAELDARSQDQGGEVIDIAGKDADEKVETESKIAASETKMSKSGPTKAELVKQNEKLLKEKPKGFMDKIKANAAKIKSMVKDAASAPSSILGQKEPASQQAKKAKANIDTAVDKVRDKIPEWKEGNRQMPNRVMDKLLGDLDSDLDGMIKAKAQNFVTNDKNVIDLTKHVDITELQQAVKTELLADFRGFNKNNDSLYGYINARLKQRIGDVLPSLWTDMSQKDIDNLSTTDTKSVNETKTTVQSVPDVNLRESLKIERGSPLSDLIMETVEKVLGTKMPEFRYVRKNKGGKRTDVSLADVKKVLEKNPTGETKRQAERDLAGIYKQFSNDLETRFSEELRDAFVETFGSRVEYTNWLDINAEAISDLSIEKLVAFERLVKGEKIFTEVVKKNLSVEEVKQLEGTGLLVSATTNQGPTLYKKLNPTKDQVIDFFDIKGSKKGTRKDALADKISGELALNATMEIASKPEVMEKFELGLESSGTGEVVTKAYLQDVSKAIGRGVDLKFSKSFNNSNASIELKNTYQNNRKTFVDKLREYGVNPQGVEQAWLDAFDGSLFTTTTEGKKWAKKLKKEWSALSSEMQQVEEILTDDIQSDILNSIIDQEAGNLNDTERAELIAKAKQEAVTTKRGLDFDDIVKQLAKNLGIEKGYAYEQFVYDATERAIEQWNKENGKESALKLEGVRGEDGGKADFIATIGGNAFNVELKLGNARFGSVTVNTTTNAKGDINFNIKKDYSFNKDFLKAVDQAKKDIKVWTKRANDIGRKEFGDNWLDYKFGDQLEKKVFFQLQAEGLQKNITRTWVTDTGAIAEIYWNKENGTAYINIEGKGLYKFRNPNDPQLENPANLDGDSVPYFDGSVTWSFAIAKTTAHSKGGPTKYKDAGIKLVDGKLPGSEGWANVGLRMQPSKIKGLPEAKIDMSSIQGIIDLQNMPAVNQGLDVKKGEASEVNIKNNSDSKVVPDYKMSKTTNPESLRQADILDKALSIARDPNAPIKKIRVFDFDDTLARTNSNVLYTMPDGTTGKLTAEEFAKKGDEMQADGAVWDFSEFNKVVDGKKGPLFRVAQKIQEARGTDDVFVLTARSADAAPAIQEFLNSIGLNIPIENITGLGDSSPLAKSGWMVDKAAEGYNDFYFADDHLGNIDAVDLAMSVIDVKSKTQQAKMNFSKTVPEVMNDIIFDKTGIESYKEYSSMRAKAKGRKKRSWSLIAPSAQDFGGLLYKLLAKGEKGNAQWEWMQENLIKPFSRGMNDLSIAQNQLMSDFKALKNSLEGIPTNLKKQAFGGFTYEDITRIAAWHKQGIKIDGLSNRDLKQIMDFVEGMPEINLFVDQLIELTKGDGYHYPGGDWLAGTITTDFMGGLKSTTRPRVLKQWIENIDLAFDEKTLNKLEAAFGPKYREAIEDSIRRMKTGQNRKQGMSRLEQRFQDYINNSVGAVMFLNARSAVLQTISAINFVNWTDNNPLKAGQAFANQKQYWTDFMSLMNSDFLVDRRNGLKINVSESEIAEAAKSTGNSVKGVISFLLNKGFVLTQIADSFAIASGGATFYRNRVNTYMKQGMSKADAEAKAFLDFRDTAEESQQSARADKISQQQASTLGRVILAFANTPSQYTRIMDKAGRDLMAGRGDWKNNLSKIAYYGFVQNLMFTALQSALFAVGFGEDEEEVDEKTLETANSMLDNIMRGAGVQGVILATVKNAILDLYERSKLEGSWPGPEYSESVWKLLEVSPPLSIKAKKYKSGMKDYELNSWRPEAKDPFNINNPSYRAAAKVIAALTNVPVDRLFQKMENVQGAMDANNDAWQRVMMLMGWPKWQLENQIQKLERYAKEKQGRKEYRQHVKDSKTRKYTYKPLPTKEEYKQQELEKQKVVLFKLKKAEQIDSLRTLGLTTDAIKRLKYEEDRVNKILELNNK